MCACCNLVAQPVAPEFTFEQRPRLRLEAGQDQRVLRHVQQRSGRTGSEGVIARNEEEALRGKQGFEIEAAPAARLGRDGEVHSTGLQQFADFVLRSRQA